MPVSYNPELVAYAVKLAKEGRRQNMIVDELLKLRIPPEQAKAVAALVFRKKQAVYRRQGIVVFLFGLLLFGFGMYVLWASYTTADSRGGWFVAPIGLILSGGFSLIRGLTWMIAG